MRHQLLLPLFLVPVVLSSEAMTVPWHEFHVSRCEMVFSPQERRLVATLHIFADDLLFALTGDKQTDIAQLESEDIDARIESYLSQNLSVSVGQEVIPYTFTGRELSEDETVMEVTLQLVLPRTPDHITVTNSLLVDQFGDQRNIVVLKQGAGRGQVFVFSKSKSEIQIPLE